MVRFLITFAILWACLRRSTELAAAEPRVVFLVGYVFPAIVAALYAIAMKPSRTLLGLSPSKQHDQGVRRELDEQNRKRSP